MFRIGRSAGDLQGIHTFKTLQLTSAKTLNTSLLPASYSEKHAHWDLSSPQQHHQHQSAFSLLSQCITLIIHIFQKLNPVLKSTLIGQIEQRMEKIDKKFISHVNKLHYMRESMHKLEFQEVEVHIFKEWKRNPLLNQLRLIWIQGLYGIQLNQFEVQYARGRELIGQLALLFFGIFFTNNSKNSSQSWKQKILTKLIDRTSHLIITNCSEWQILYRSSIAPTISCAYKQTTPKIPPPESFLFSLSPAKSCFKTCCQPLQNFIKFPCLLSKIKNLIRFRQSLQMQIRRLQQQMIDKKIRKQIKVCDKDDFIDCILVCLTNFDIDFWHLDLAVRYVDSLGADQLMVRYQAHAFFVDFVAVRDYLAMLIAEDKLRQQK